MCKEHDAIAHQRGEKEIQIKLDNIDVVNKELNSGQIPDVEGVAAGGHGTNAGGAMTQGDLRNTIWRLKGSINNLTVTKDSLIKERDIKLKKSNFRH